MPKDPPDSPPVALGTASENTGDNGATKSDLTWDAMIPGQRVDTVTVRIARHRASQRRSGPGLVVLRPEVTDPRGGLGRVLFQVKHFLIGAPLATTTAPNERLN